MNMKIYALATTGILCLAAIPANAQSVVKICVLNTANSGCTPVDSNNPLPVTGGGGGGGGTSSTFGAVFPATGTASGFKDSTGTNMVPGNLTAGGALKVDSSATNQPENLVGINSVTPLVGAGATGTGSQRITQAQDTSTVAGAAPLTTGVYVTGPSAAALATSALQTTGNTSAATIATNTGNTATNTATIAAAVGSSIPAGSALIGKVGIDQTTPGTTNAVQNISGTTGGVTPFTLTAANSTNCQNVKATPGTLYHIGVYNNSATLAWVSFYNTAGTPTGGTGIVYQTMIPANSTSGGGAVEDFSTGMAFGTGIGICVTTGIAGTGSVAASAYVIGLGYK